MLSIRKVDGKVRKKRISWKEHWDLDMVTGCLGAISQPGTSEGQMT